MAIIILKFHKNYFVIKTGIFFSINVKKIKNVIKIY